MARLTSRTYFSQANFMISSMFDGPEDFFSVGLQATFDRRKTELDPGVCKLSLNCQATARSELNGATSSGKPASQTDRTRESHGELYRAIGCHDGDIHRTA
jgi:hypothetical protein